MRSQQSHIGDQKHVLGSVVDDQLAIPSGWQPLHGRPIENAIQMFKSQTLFWPMDARPEEIHLEDVAFSLSRQIRFSGQTEIPYNVAWHSVALSNVVPDHLKKWALIHDVAEGYISDICRPIKKLPAFEKYLEVEAKLMEAVAERFGMDSSKQPKELDHYDCLMGTVELYYNQGDIGLAKLKALSDIPVHNMDAEEFTTWKPYVVNSPNMNASETLWLARYDQLFNT